LSDVTLIANSLGQIKEAISCKEARTMIVEKRWSSIFLLVVILLSVMALANGCGQRVKDGVPSPTPASVPAPTPTGALKGVSLSPRGFQAADFTDFFETAKQTGEVISWAGDWNELDVTKSGGAKVVTELASKYNYIPVIEAQFFNQSTGKLLRSLDGATRQAYKNNAVAFAKKYGPRYLAFGIEVNTLYEKSPTDFELFVPFYAEVYDAVKAASPNTRVFTIFQLEKMKGLSGGLLGGTNDPNKAQWHLLNRPPNSDIIAFTTYPDLIYKNPSDIPADYYAEIKSHTSKEIAFTEIGWHSSRSPAGWESSDAEQAEFITRFFDLTGGLNKEMAIWSFMYDQKAIEPFNSMGLRRSDGTARPAWDEWIREK